MLKSMSTVISHFRLIYVDVQMMRNAEEGLGLMLRDFNWSRISDWTATFLGGNPNIDNKEHLVSILAHRAQWIEHDFIAVIV